MKKKNHGWWWPMKGLKKCHDKFKKKKKSYLKLLLYPRDILTTKKKKNLSQTSIISKRYFDYKLYYSPRL